MSYYPTYSHGGPTWSGWTAVPGNTSGPGRAISLIGATQTTAMFFVVTGSSGSITVNLEANGGPVGTNYLPPSTDWIVTWTGVFDFGNAIGKKIQMTAPFWRTNITARSGDCVLASYVGVGKTGPNGVTVYMPSYPVRQLDATMQQGI